MNTKKLSVSKREVVGTGKLNKLRAQNFVPGVIYGHTLKENINIQIKESDLRVLLGLDETDSLPVELDLDGQKILSLIKNVQHNHLTDSTTHVDFQSVTPDSMVLVKVPVHLSGTPVGVAMGGQVQQLVHQLPIRCKVKDIPEEISASIASLELEQSLRLSQVTLPENVSTPFNGTVVLASVVKP